MSGTAAGTVRKVTTGQSYINNKLFTASSAAERKLCANADWLSKGNAALGDGVLKGISQAVTDIWNQSMSASPIGKLFPEPGKKSGPGIGNTVMEITERVIKEQEQRKEQERIWESRYELRYGEDGEEIPVKNGWITLYTNPTVSGQGNVIMPHPDAKKYDWGMPEELYKLLDEKQLPGQVTKEYESIGEKPIINVTSNNLYTDGEGRYWVAVGPNVMNPEHQSNEEIKAEEMKYGTKIDIVVRENNTEKVYYIPAVVGDVKANSAPDGLYQTGRGFPGVEDSFKHNDGSTVEFLGWNIKGNTVNLTNNYQILQIIVYEGKISDGEV